MPEITHTTALLLTPPASRGTTAELYRKDPGSGSLLSRALGATSGWPVDEAVLVLGDDAELLLDDVDSEIEVLIDPEWGEGAAAALRAGFDLIVREDRADAVLVVSLDRPVPDAALVGRILETGRAAIRPIVAAKFRYAFDYPYLVFPEVWGRILGLEGGASLPSLVASHPEWVVEAWIDRVPPRRFESADDVGARR